MMRGIFIALEGGDGAGKATQAKELARRLKEHHEVMTISFPRYGETSARMVEAYLRGDFGPKEAFSPYVSSALYAHDRRAAKPEIEKALAEGKVVLTDRYVSSNLAHQGAHVSNPALRAEFLKRIDKLEYEWIGLPRPDIIIVLEAQAEDRDRNVEKKEARAYLRGAKKDINEGDLPYQKRVDRVYHELGMNAQDHVLVNCMENGQILPINTCHEKIWAHVCPLITKVAELQP